MAYTVYEEVQRAEAKQVVRVVSDYVNNYGHSKEQFAQAMAEEHRTLQQSFTGVCLAWLKLLASRREHEYDPRNEASVKLARAIDQRMREEYGDGWDHLPLI